MDGEGGYRAVRGLSAVAVATPTDRSVGLGELAARAQTGGAPRARARSPTKEVWRIVPGFAAYSVSNLGRVKSSKRWRDGKTVRYLSPRRQFHRRGYLTGVSVVLFKDNKRHPAQISHIVLSAFVGARPISLEACHGDGNPANNRLRNLRWDTHQSNLHDTIRHGRTTAKISIEEVERAKDLRSAGVMYKDILKWLQLPVGRPALSLAVNGLSRGQLSGG